MNQEINTAVIVGPAKDDHAWAQKVVNSATFSRSPRLRSLLSYIVDCTLKGALEELSETRIAECVFDRRSYHPAEDNLVRVSVRQLRSKLAEYYQDEGQHDSSHIEIPKGAYHAVFRTHDPVTDPAQVLLPDAAPLPVAPSRNWRRILAVGLAVISLVLLALLIQARSEVHRLREVSRAVSQPTLFDQFIASQGRTQVVVTDSALILYEALAHRYLNLEEYSAHALPDPPDLKSPQLQEFLNLLRKRQITSLADTRILTALVQTYPSYAHNVAVHHAREMHARDFTGHDNFIIIGSYRSNPWVTLFENQATFRFASAFGDNCLNDVTAQPSVNFCSQNPLEETGVDFARILVTHNDGGSGRVLTIAGLRMESTEAAGNYFLDPASVPQVLDALGCDQIKNLPDYELLIRSNSIGGTGRSAKLIHARRLRQ